ncbi:MAG TPA: ATP-binding protein [Patescibacteria group bacterium]|nr:ATP-binding protein [Patescibacteria group bacterium]
MAARLTALGATAWLPRVAVTIVVVLTASVASVLVRPLTHAADSPLFVAAVMVSAWYGGLGCGLLATALAALALDAEMASTRRMLAVNDEVVARLVVFVCVALFVSALDHARRRSAAQRGVFLEREQAARAEAEAANRAKDEFVTMVAHELRTPLTAILGWSAAMSDARLGPALADRALEAIRRNATLQARVIADLVDLSRLGRGRLSLHLDTVDLRIVIDAAVEAVAVTAGARGIKMATELASGCPQVRGDAARLQQVVSNLLANAMKHSDCGTTAHIALDAAAAAARIVVRDEGHGIAPELLPHVFEPYRQGDGLAARSGLGAGARHRPSARRAPWRPRGGEQPGRRPGGVFHGAVAHDAVARLRSGASAAPEARGRSARRRCCPRGSSRADESRCTGIRPRRRASA